MRQYAVCICCVLLWALAAQVKPAQCTESLNRSVAFMSEVKETKSVYQRLLDAGFSHEEIQNALRKRGLTAGFSEQEINAYFSKYAPAKAATPSKNGEQDLKERMIRLRESAEDLGSLQ